MTLTVGINAKEWKENDRGFLVELTAGYANATSYTPSERYANISPGIGYQFNKRWAAGFRMTFESRRYDFKIYTPFVRFNYLSRPRWTLFAEAQGNIGSRDVDGAQCRYYEAGVGLGGTFSITPHLKLVGRYLFVGYRVPVMNVSVPMQETMISFWTQMSLVCRSDCSTCSDRTENRGLP